MSALSGSNISGVVNSRRSTRLPASFAVCIRMYESFAWRRKPSASKPTGMLAASLAGCASNPADWEGGGAATVSLPRPEYCIGPPAAAGCGLARPRISKRITNTTATASRAIINMLPIAPPKPPPPNIDPRSPPIARPPSIGAQRLSADWGWGAAAGGVAGAACCAWRGGVACGVVVILRWVPMLRLPPSFAASA